MLKKRLNNKSIDLNLGYINSLKYNNGYWNY